MNFPENLKYTKTHEWVLFSGNGSATVGLTEYAQEALGSLVFINLPQEGDAATAGESIGDVESVKAVSEFYSPLTGVIKAVNEALLDSPGNVNDDPYGSWLVEITDISAQTDLMDAAEYETFCKKEE